MHKPNANKVNTSPFELGCDQHLPLPDTKPRDDPVALWSLQVNLLAAAEKALGPRDKSKKIYQPQFTDNGPMLRNTSELDGVYTELSRGAEGNWFTTAFEMAHETVHLLNPTIGGTNYFEEGIAVHFSLTLAPEYNNYIRCSNSDYCEALNLVEEFSKSPMEMGRLARERFGALSKVSTAKLEELCPTAERELLVRLAEEFPIVSRTKSQDPTAE